MEQSFYSWSFDIRKGSGRKGPGYWNSMELGARDRMSGRKFDNIFTRSDCKLAYETGFRKMAEYLKAGNTIICDDCNNTIGEGGHKNLIEQLILFTNEDGTLVQGFRTMEIIKKMEELIKKSKGEK